MSAAHGGYGSEKVPLGGGAAVFERLLHCPAFLQHQLELIAPGPSAPPAGQYHRVLSQDRAPSALGMMEYARFSRDFGEATTRAALDLKPDLLICHDISEGPDVQVLREAGIPVATIFHVDVVDIFNRLYLAGIASPENLTQKYRRFRHLPWPHVLQLVFEKQQQVADHGVLSVVPSKGSQALVERCYPQGRAPVHTVGWGVPNCPFSPSDIELKAQSLREQYQIPSEHRILLTLSRLSPEKAQHRLLQAVSFAESEGRMPRDVTLVIAGAPAFMDGKRHHRKLLKLSERLKTRVVFPGHVGGVEKAAWYRNAHLFVVNSLHESYGLTTLEAMQQACPVVAVRSFGTADTVTPEVGRLVPQGPELPIRLWGTLELYLNPGSEDRHRNLSEAAQQKAARESFENAAAKLESLCLQASKNFGKSKA